MTSRKPYPMDEPTVWELRTQLGASSSPEGMVEPLRCAGFSKIDSIKFLRDFAGLTLREGKAMVHLSPAWADRYASDEAFHDAAEQAAEQLFNEETTTA